MLFNSIDFLVFFPVVLIFYFLIPSRARWFFLLFASCYFYMAFVPWYILILFFLILVDYFMGLLIDRSEGGRRKLFLVISIFSNLGILFVFKYFNFFNENTAQLAQWIGWNYSIESLSILLPIGLSFHIFQSLSYVIEVYRRKYAAEKHLGIYALYVMFFPQLVAGPIERPQHLLPQLHRPLPFSYERAFDGLSLMLWGFFKKLVIADQLAVVVDHVYGNIYAMPPAAIFIAVILFAFQLYCDFSGYSDIAIGSARILGVDLSLNFARPYASRSIAEFWRRWHISLSNWLRDYLYYPLALSRIGSPKTRVYLATLFTFVLIGLWHGANWTFVLLGATHGMYLVVAMLTKKWRERCVTLIGLAKLPQVLHLWQVVVTFMLVSVSWIFFRAQSVPEAFFIISSLPAGFVQLFDLAYMREHVLVSATLGVGGLFLALRVLAVFFMEFVEFVVGKFVSLRAMVLGWPLVWRLSAYYFIVIWILLLGHFGEKSFIYFQF